MARISANGSAELRRRAKEVRDDRETGSRDGNAQRMTANADDDNIADDNIEVITGPESGPGPEDASPGLRVPGGRFRLGAPDGARLR